MLDRIPLELKGLINKVRQQASAGGLRVYLVGGFVRDLILGVKNLDLDIVIEGDGIKFAQVFGKSTGGKVTVHKSFGTATLKLDSGLKIDFSSARKEFYPKPAHLPLVSPGLLRDDLSRRDFTINAMAISLHEGRLIDYFCGIKDLENKKIRILHDLSFSDDPTRILRGIRFEQRLHFNIEPKTLRLLKEAVQSGFLQMVHPHRTRDDLILALKEQEPVKNIKRMDQLVGFTFIHPKLKVTARTYAYLMSLEKEIKWFNKNYPRRRGLDTWLIYFIGLLDHLSARATVDICKRLGLRKGEAKRILTSRGARRTFIAALSSREFKPSKIYALLEPLSYETIISIRAKHKSRTLRNNIAAFLEIYNGMCILVSGSDLRCLGVPPGPRYKKVFSCVLNAKLNGKVRNKEEELLLIRELLKTGA